MLLAPCSLPLYGILLLLAPCSLPLYGILLLLAPCSLPLFSVSPEVVILRHHDEVSAGELFLKVKDAAPNTIIKYVGPLVAARHDYRAVGAVLAIAVLEGFDEFVAREHPDIGEALAPELGELEHFTFLDEAAEHRGVPEDARLLELAHHFRQAALRHLHAVALEHHLVQRRTLFLTDGRQLRRVAHKDEAAAFAGIDVVHQVVEQTPCPEDGAAARLVGYHRCLVHDEERVLPEVDVVLEDIHLRDGLLPVYLPMYSICGRACVRGQDLSGASRRSKQHDALPELLHRAHQSSQKRRLARAGIALEQEYFILLSRQHKVGEQGNDFFLLFRRIMDEVLPYKEP